MSTTTSIRTIPRSLLAASSALLLACSSDPVEDSSSTTGATSSSSGATSSSSGTGGGGGSGPLTYGPCPEGYLTECATIQVPLDHAHPGETIDFHFARYPAAMQPAKRQVWLLAGGPGQAGYVYGKRVAALAEAMPDADIFAPDHRGTGYSHRLSCPQQDAPNTYGGYVLDPIDGEACLEALKAKGDFQRLAYFTTTQAAGDVLAGIAAARTSAEEKVFVIGASYGTHWAHRMVQLAPNDLDGVVFDGFLTPHHFAFLDYDGAAEEAGEALAAACDADASCTAHLGPGGALAKVHAVLDTLGTTPCGPFTKEQARTLISVLLDPWGGRAMIFPAVHRLERCTDADQDALVFLANTYYGLLANAYKVPFVNSGILQNNIVLSELWALPGEVEPPKAEMIAAADAQAFLAGGSLPGKLVDMRAYWPQPPDDYSALPFPANTTAKMLWLGAKLDAHASVSQAGKITEVYPSADYVSLDGASHTPMGQSPLASDPTKTCGAKIATSFVESDGVLDASCATDDLLPLRLEAPDGMFATKWWNTADDWGDGTPKPLALAGASVVVEPTMAVRLPR
ncbi:MAG: alpha/beta fold hydrolase [Polyangiaceae bacterium]